LRRAAPGSRPIVLCCSARRRHHTCTHTCASGSCRQACACNHAARSHAHVVLRRARAVAVRKTRTKRSVSPASVLSPPGCAAAAAVAARAAAWMAANAASLTDDAPPALGGACAGAPPDDMPSPSCDARGADSDGDGACGDAPCMRGVPSARCCSPATAAMRASVAGSAPQPMKAYAPLDWRDTTPSVSSTFTTSAQSSHPSVRGGCVSARARCARERAETQAAKVHHKHAQAGSAP
jgi:hypothetical protein